MARTALALSNSLLFNGIGDYVNGGTPYSFGTGELTMEAWVKTTNADATYRIAISIGTSSTNAQLALYQDNLHQVMVAPYGTNGPQFSETLLNDGLWHHLAATKSGDNLTIFLDGVQKNTAVRTGINIGTNHFFLGSSDGTQLYWPGNMAEVRLWNKALNVNDLLNHAQNPSSVSTVNTASCSYENNCVDHYKMLEGSGTLLTNIKSPRNGIFQSSGHPAWNSSIPNGLTSRIINSARTAASARSAASARGAA